MTPVFLDTVGLIALWDEADQWHLAASDVFSVLLAAKAPYLTTTPVLYECGNAAARKPFRHRITAIRQALLAGGGLIEPTTADVDHAWSLFENGRSHDPGIVDCISFVVMRRLGLTEAFTNDQHFAAAGFTTLF